MLKPSDPNARYCYERAFEARERSFKCDHPNIRDEYLASEARWLKLAESYELSERLSGFLKKPKTFPHHPECATCHVPMWLIKIESDRERIEYFYECNACDAKATMTEVEQRHETKAE